MEASCEIHPRTAPAFTLWLQLDFDSREGSNPLVLTTLEQNRGGSQPTREKSGFGVLDFNGSAQAGGSGQR